MTIWTILYNNGLSTPHEVYQTPFLTFDAALIQQPTSSMVSTGIAGIETSYTEDHTYPPEQGSRGVLFGSDFYNRMHVYPDNVDFGNLVGIQYIDINIWNAYYYDIRVVSETLSNGEGVTTLGSRAVPFNFSPLEILAWRITGEQAGPPVIDATYTLDLIGAPDIVIPIIGQRVLMFDWLPDWREGVTESYEWVTDVLKMRNGAEQRRNIRKYPRRVYEFSPFANGLDRRYFESVMFNWGSGVFAVPSWQDQSRLVDPINLGSLTIPVNTKATHYRVGGFVVFIDYDNKINEICEIAVVAENLLTLLRPTVNAWPTGTYLFPAVSMRLVNQPNLLRGTRQHTYTRVTFEEITGVELSDSHTYPIHYGYPVLEQKVNWVTEPSVSYDRDIDIFDSVSGKVYYEDATNIPYPTYKNEYTLSNRSDVNNYIALLQTLRGRHSPVWVSTDASDINVVAPLLSSEVTMTVSHFKYTDYVSTLPGKKHCRIELHSGDVFYRKIVNTENNGATELLTIDTPLGIDIVPNDILCVSFMGLCRSDADRIEHTWLNGNALTAMLTFKGFKNDI